MDRGKLGTKRSLLVDRAGIPLVRDRPGQPPRLAAAAPDLGQAGPLDQGLGSTLPAKITVHPDAGYDSTKTRDLLSEGLPRRDEPHRLPLQAGARWVVERTNSWHTRGFKKLAICTERHTRVIEAFIALANALIITRRLIRVAWTTHPWDTRPARRPLTYPRDL